MTRDPIRITREELHRLLWSKTMRRVAEELGTSYVELVRACATMNVPRPKAGEWKSLMLGQVVEPVPLPEAEPGIALEVYLRPVEVFNEEDLPPLPDSEQAEPVEEVQSAAGPVGEKVAEPVRERGPVTVSRQELYDRVWQTSLKQLAKEWGTNYTSLVAACAVMSVPRPANGHWSRVSLGLPVEKLELPEAMPGIPTEVTLDPQLLREERAAKTAEARRAEAVTGEPVGSLIAEDVTKESVSGEQKECDPGVEHSTEEGAAGAKSVVKRSITDGLELPKEDVALHPIAERHVDALQKGKVDDLGFVSIGGADLFVCEMTLALVPRFGRALHAFICELERRGYGFIGGEEEGETLGIVRDGDRVEMRWSESRFEFEREPTYTEKRKPSWTWNLKETRATGELEVEVVAAGMRGRRKLEEGNGRSLEQLLSLAVERVEASFRWFVDQRKREAERARQSEEAEKLRLEEEGREAARQARLEDERKARERVRRHERKLEQIAELRRQNLLVAAKLWIQARGVTAYVAYCEATWRLSSGGTLTQAQADWLAWAKEEALKIGPFGRGYPVLERDGRLDVEAIPVGGPYPEPTELEELAEAEVEEPEKKAEVKYVEVPRQPEQYPFWLLHRRH